MLLRRVCLIESVTEYHTHFSYVLQKDNPNSDGRLSKYLFDAITTRFHKKKKNLTKRLYTGNNESPVGPTSALTRQHNQRMSSSLTVTKLTRLL